MSYIKIVESRLKVPRRQRLGPASLRYQVLGKERKLETAAVREEDEYKYKERKESEQKPRERLKRKDNYRRRRS